MKFRNFIPVLLIFTLVFFVSCKKDQPPVEENQTVSGGGNGYVYVLNEGNFMAANASLTQLNLSNGTIVADAYASANNGNHAGDVMQSMCSYNGKYYLVMNNSSKILVLNKYSLSQTGVINNIGSPRYFLPVNNNKAYVTDLYANAVSVVDLNTLQKTGSISIHGWTEELVMVYGKVYVTNKSSDYLYVIDAANDVLMDSINVGYGSNSVCQDKNGSIWVLASGNGSNAAAHLTKINPITNTIDTSYVFSSVTESPWRLRINHTKDQLYWIGNSGIFTFPITATALPNSAVIAQGTKIFYGLAIDPVDGTIYVADAIDYNQNGKVYRYNTSHNVIDNFNAGIIPGEFYFEK